MAAHDEIPNMRGEEISRFDPARFRVTPGFDPTKYRDRKKIDKKSLKIYFAGPIEKNCWRHKIVPGLREGRPNIEPHQYVGPFFVGCDHGCAHGRTSHGIGADGIEHRACAEDHLLESGALNRDQVRRRCMSQIESADLIFTWIDRMDAYGTIWELGYAAAKEKRAVVRWPHGLKVHEMWLSLPEDARSAESAEFAFRETIGSHLRLLPTESPIEESLLEALVLIPEIARGDFVLKTRQEVGPYFLDFALWSKERNWRLAVECDGHEFHEKTKEQVARDKKRERYIVFEGWTVIRFAGSEIYRDAAGCATEVLKQCLKLEGR